MSVCKNGEPKGARFVTTVEAMEQKIVTERSRVSIFAGKSAQLAQGYLLTAAGLLFGA